MNKFIFAFVAFLAVAQAKPYISNGASYSAPASVAYQAVPVQVSYQQAPAVNYVPVSVPYNSGNYAKPTPLVAAPSNPAASAAAAAVGASLNPGIYSQIAIPSYQYISGVPAIGNSRLISLGNPVGNYGGNYGAAAY